MWYSQQILEQTKSGNLPHKSYDFQKEFDIAYAPNYWANEQTSMYCLYIQQTRTELSMSEDYHWLLIPYVFNRQWTDAVKLVVAQSEGKLFLAPLDISANELS